MEGPLLAWWLALCAAALVNPFLWMWSARRLGRRAPGMPPEMRVSRELILWLSAAYVFGCAFRSILPMIDAPRLCLHDTWISRIAVGRTIATVAELSFAAQWALLLRDAGTGAPVAAFASRAIFPIIVAAEISSWGAVLTSNYLLHAVENSLWTLAAVLALAAFLSLRPRVDKDAARFLAAASVSAAVYIAYMAIADVPMYLERWHAAAGTVPLAQGLRTLVELCVVRRDWSAWREDATWLSLYFTVGVWVSITLAHAPRLRISR
jgi:hypothetical protein